MKQNYCFSYRLLLRLTWFRERMRIRMWEFKMSSYSKTLSKFSLITGVDYLQAQTHFEPGKSSKNQPIKNQRNQKIILKNEMEE